MIQTEKTHPTDPLRAYIQQEILPRYDRFDHAHGRDHAERVMAESLRLAAHYDVDTDMVYTIAAYHDIGMAAGRELHHIESGKMLLADPALRGFFRQEQLLVMRDAVEDHRASARRPPRTIYGMIVAEADREIDVEVTVRRTIQYGQSHYPHLPREEQYRRMREHLVEKYAEGGYLKLWIPQSGNAERLRELRRLIADEAGLRAAFNRICPPNGTTT